MKTDRFSSTSFRIVGILLASLFVAAGLSAAGKSIRLGRVKISLDSPSKQLAQALAPQVEEVQNRFDANRRALQVVQGPGGASGYLPQDVTNLIVHTGEDLDKAIEKVQPSGTEPLRAWVSDEFLQIQKKVPAPGPIAMLPVPSAPRAVAVFASLRGFGQPVFASMKPPKPAPPKSKPAPPKPAPPPQPQTIPTATADGLLDQAREVVERIFLLASKDDLEVKLWVGSTPAPRVTFSFWSQGKLKGAEQAPMIIRTNNKRDRVLRGLYSYRAAWAKGAVTDLIQYPDPAGTPMAQQSERLDLVNGTGFFCCRFGEHYCQQVDNEKDCRP